MSNYLAHYGVLGMKWGVRRTPAQLGRTMSTRKRQLAADKSDLKKLNSGKHFSVGFTKKRQDAYDKRDKTVLERRIKDTEQAVARQAAKNKAQRQTKVERKAKIKSTYKEINKQTNFVDKMTYNRATRKRAAKYVVDNNMSMTKATAKAHYDAKRNTLVLLGAVGAMSVAQLAISKVT